MRKSLQKRIEEMLKKRIPKRLNNDQKMTKQSSQINKGSIQKSRWRPNGAGIAPKGNKMGENVSKMVSKIRCLKKVGSGRDPRRRFQNSGEPFLIKMVLRCLLLDAFVGPLSIKNEIKKRPRHRKQKKTENQRKIYHFLGSFRG